MQHFLSLNNVELKPENSGIENYRFENAKNATFSIPGQCVIDLRKLGDSEQLQENQAL